MKGYLLAHFISLNANIQHKAHKIALQFVLYDTVRNKM